MIMKRHIKWCCIITCLAILLTACGGSQTKTDVGQATMDNDEKSYTFSVANFYATVNNHSLLTQAWCDEITEKTNGRVIFEYYPGASFVSAANSYDGVLNGIVDIAMTATANTPGVFPIMSLVELPQGYTNGWVGTQVCNDFIKHFGLKELSSVKVLYAHAVSPLIIMGNKEIHNANDFVGMTIRTGSELATATVNALGAQNYSCQITELYEALTKNIVEGAISGKDILEGFNIGEVVDYAIDDPSYGKIGVIAMFMNSQKWESLPDDIKKIFEEVNGKYAELQGKCWHFEDLTAYKNFEEKGGKVIKFSEDVSTELSKKLETVNAKFIKDLGIPENEVVEYQKYIEERIDYWSSQIPSDEEILKWGSSYFEI